VSQLEAHAIGARIALARDLTGLTQEQVGEIATFSARSLQDWEAGVRIPFKHMREIAALFNVSIEWLLHGTPEPHADAEAGDVRAEVEALRKEARDQHQEVLRRLGELGQPRQGNRE